MREVIGYSYDIYYDGGIIHEETTLFETGEEAFEDGKMYVVDQIDEWKADDAWHPEDGRDSEDWFSIEVYEVKE